MGMNMNIAAIMFDYMCYLRIENERSTNVLTQTNKQTDRQTDRHWKRKRRARKQKIIQFDHFADWRGFNKFTRRVRKSTAFQRHTIQIKWKSKLFWVNSGEKVESVMREKTHFVSHHIDFHRHFNIGTKIQNHFPLLIHQIQIYVRQWEKNEFFPISCEKTIQKHISLFMRSKDAEERMNERESERRESIQSSPIVFTLKLSWSKVRMPFSLPH